MLAPKKLFLILSLIATLVETNPRHKREFSFELGNHDEGEHTPNPGFGASFFKGIQPTLSKTFGDLCTRFARTIDDCDGDKCDVEEDTQPKDNLFMRILKRIWHVVKMPFRSIAGVVCTQLAQKGIEELAEQVLSG